MSAVCVDAGRCLSVCSTLGFSDFQWFVHHSGDGDFCCSVSSIRRSGSAFTYMVCRRSGLPAGRVDHLGRGVSLGIVAGGLRCDRPRRFSPVCCRRRSPRQPVCSVCRRWAWSMCRRCRSGGLPSPRRFPAVAAVCLGAAACRSAGQCADRRWPAPIRTDGGSLPAGGRRRPSATRFTLPFFVSAGRTNPLPAPTPYSHVRSLLSASFVAHACTGVRLVGSPRRRSSPFCVLPSASHPHSGVPPHHRLSSPCVLPHTRRSPPVWRLHGVPSRWWVVSVVLRVGGRCGADTGVWGWFPSHCAWGEGFAGGWWV